MIDILACEEIVMKEMVYREKPGLDSHTRILDEGNYEGYQYIIGFLGDIYPVAYVSLPNSSPLYGLEDIDTINEYLKGYAGEVPCHGGITFANEYPCFLCKSRGVLDGITRLEPGWYIGWDYAHEDDFHPIFNQDGRKWTTGEILGDVHNVIGVLNASRVTKGE